VAVVAEQDGSRALAAWRETSGGAGAAVIGTVSSGARARVVLRGGHGRARLLARPSGELLPRIC